MTLSVTVDETGIHAPTFAEILEDLKNQFRSIYGSDVDLDPDTADGQMLAIFASAINDANQSAINAFNAFAPNYAQGVGLSNLVKINGIRRRVATNSTAVVTLSGQAGAEIVDGVVEDEAGNLWDLPALSVIGGGGTVDVTATAQEVGAIIAAAGTINQISNPQRGWQGVTNAVEATVGAPVETDAELRRRQAISVAMPAQSILASLSAGIGDVDGVTRHFVYENDTDSTDSNGIPAHSIAAVVAGGDADEIGEQIALRKSPGIQTYGDVDVTVLDSRGVPIEVHFFALDAVAIDVEITITTLPGYVSSTDDLIKAAIAYHLDALDIGEDSYLSRLYAPANLSGAAAVAATGMTQEALDVLANTYNVTLVRQAKSGDPLAAADVVIDFDEAATGDVADVTVL